MLWSVLTDSGLTQNNEKTNRIPLGGSKLARASRKSWTLAMACLFSVDEILDLDFYPNAEE
jgi:hypothetical protein